MHRGGSSLLTAVQSVERTHGLDRQSPHDEGGLRAGLPGAARVCREPSGRLSCASGLGLLSAGAGLAHPPFPATPGHAGFYPDLSGHLPTALGVSQWVVCSPRYVLLAAVVRGGGRRPDLGPAGELSLPVGQGEAATSSRGLQPPTLACVRPAFPALLGLGVVSFVSPALLAGSALRCLSLLCVCSRGYHSRSLVLF